MRAIDAIGESSRPRWNASTAAFAASAAARPCPRPSTTSTRSTVGLDITAHPSPHSISPGYGTDTTPSSISSTAARRSGTTGNTGEDDGSLGGAGVDVEGFRRPPNGAEAGAGAAARRVSVVEASSPVCHPRSRVDRKQLHGRLQVIAPCGDDELPAAAVLDEVGRQLGRDEGDFALGVGVELKRGRARERGTSGLGDLAAFLDDDGGGRHAHRAIVDASAAARFRLDRELVAEPLRSAKSETEAASRGEPVGQRARDIRDTRGPGPRR